ncbi:hypothetical protein F4861DRAFT_548115, partial [Xylaria intraflava]
ISGFDIPKLSWFRNVSSLRHTITSHILPNSIMPRITRSSLNGHQAINDNGDDTTGNRNTATPRRPTRASAGLQSSSSLGAILPASGSSNTGNTNQSHEEGPGEELPLDIVRAIAGFMPTAANNGGVISYDDGTIYLPPQFTGRLGSRRDESDRAKPFRCNQYGCTFRTRLNQLVNEHQRSQHIGRVCYFHDEEEVPCLFRGESDAEMLEHFSTHIPAGQFGMRAFISTVFGELSRSLSLIRMQRLILKRHNLSTLKDTAISVEMCRNVQQEAHVDPSVLSQFTIAYVFMVFSRGITLKRSFISCERSDLTTPTSTSRITFCGYEPAFSESSKKKSEKFAVFSRESFLRIIVQLHRLRPMISNPRFPSLTSPSFPESFSLRLIVHHRELRFVVSNSRFPTRKQNSEKFADFSREFSLRSIVHHCECSHEPVFSDSQELREFRRLFKRVSTIRSIVHHRELICGNEPAFYESQGIIIREVRRLFQRVFLTRNSSTSRITICGV